MKIILDADVLLTGILFSGPPHEILKAWRDGKLHLVISREILGEYQKAGACLAEQFPLIDLRPVLGMIRDKAETVAVQCLLTPLCDDPGNEKYADCALAGKCQVIVSADKHLLKISGIGRIEVLKPKEFVAMYLGKTGKSKGPGNQTYHNQGGS